MKILKGYEVEKVERYDGIFTQLFPIEKFTFIHLQINPGKELEEHINEENITFFIISGEGVFLYQGEEYIAKQGTFIEVEAGSMRGWRNDRQEEVNILVIKEK